MKKVLFLSAVALFSTTHSIYSQQISIYSYRDGIVEVEAKNGKQPFKYGANKVIRLPYSGELILHDQLTSTTYKIDKDTIQEIIKANDALFISQDSSEKDAMTLKITAYSAHQISEEEAKELQRQWNEERLPKQGGKSIRFAFPDDNKIFKSNFDKNISLNKVK